VCNIHTKQVIWGLDGDELPQQEIFPLEPISVSVGQEKMTSDTSAEIRFWEHRKLAEETFFMMGLMSAHSFKEVAWMQVYDTLHTVPRLFQLWSCKQVMDIAGTNVNQAIIIEGHDPHFPSCDHTLETCAHVLHCEEAVRVDTLHRLINWLNDWLKKVGTEPNLREGLVEYARGRGNKTMEDITRGWGPGFQEMGHSQDKILGWRRFMEGMMSKEIIPIQADYVEIGACSITLDAWLQGLITKLLESTHGQWLYCNVHVHDAIVGVEALARKEEIQQFIEDQLDLGEEGLDEKNHYLLEVNLEDLESTTGEEQHYWLL
jgi:hypothetical protein